MAEIYLVLIKSDLAEKEKELDSIKHRPENSERTFGNGLPNA